MKNVCHVLANLFLSCPKAENAVKVDKHQQENDSYLRLLYKRKQHKYLNRDVAGLA